MFGRCSISFAPRFLEPYNINDLDYVQKFLERSFSTRVTTVGANKEKTTQAKSPIYSKRAALYPVKE